MESNVTEFGKLANGEVVTEYTITNANGVSLRAISYGATWTGYFVAPGKNIILNFDDLHEYETNPFHVGNTVGRVAGRLKGHQFEIAGQPVRLQPNENDNVLHSGSAGVDQLNWKGEIFLNEHDGEIRFTAHQDNEFPGSLEMMVIYKLADTNEVSITYQGLSSEETLFNPTTHVYFNLEGPDAPVKDQYIQLFADKHMEVDGEKLPTGKLADVTDTVYDFRNLVNLGEKTRQLGGNEQFDDVFRKMDVSPIGFMTDSHQKNTLAISSDRNGIVIFNANPNVIGKSDDWIAAHPDNGLAIELQTLPDAIHHDDFGDIVLPANTIKRYTSTFLYTEED